MVVAKKAVRRPVKVVKPPVAKVVPAAPVARKPTSKAAAFALRAEAAGWEVERKIEGDTKTAICKRDDETVEVGWTKEVAHGPIIGVHVYPAGTSGIKNAASAFRIIEGKPGEFIPSEKGMKSKNSAPVVRRSKVEIASSTALPFDPYTSSDVDVLAAVRGRRITWVNSLNPDEPTEGIVPLPPSDKILPSGKVIVRRDYTEIVLSRAEDTLGERILHFCDPLVGFRALFVGAIIKVGGEQYA
jgi:hypothetical protein